MHQLYLSSIVESSRSRWIVRNRDVQKWNLDFEHRYQPKWEYLVQFRKHNGRWLKFNQALDSNGSSKSIRDMCRSRISGHQNRINMAKTILSIIVNEIICRYFRQSRFHCKTWKSKIWKSWFYLGKTAFQLVFKQLVLRKVVGSIRYSINVICRKYKMLNHLGLKYKMLNNLGLMAQVTMILLKYLVVSTTCSEAFSKDFRYYFSAISAFHIPEDPYW